MFKKMSKEFDNIIRNKFLNRTSSLELIISEKCQNACKYCYRNYKHNKSPIFKVEPGVVEDLINNFLELFKVSKEDFFSNRHVELFGGDPLVDYRNAIEIFKVIDEFKPTFISIPTNARLVSELTDYDLNILLGSTETRVGLSLSVDGMPNENNRHLSKIGKMLAYDEKINYERLFKVARKHGCGFHPMLPFNHLNKWFDTVRFFFENFGIVPYLLEVRHSLSKEDVVNAVTQIGLIRNYYEDIDEKAVGMANTIKASMVPRGLGCSGLTTAVIMPNGDMPFCHRLIDPPWVYANVNHGVDISKIVSLTSVFDHRNVPECFVCPIREQCSGQCLGACYEYWGNPFMPIPSVCDYLRLKYYIFSQRYNDWKQMLNNERKNKELEEEVLEKFGKDAVDFILENIK